MQSKSYSNNLVLIKIMIVSGSHRDAETSLLSESESEA